MLGMLIGGAVGGLLGGLSTHMRSKKEQEKLRWQKGMAQKAYGYERDYNQGTWNLQQGQALEDLGIQKNRLAEAYQADLSAFNMGVEGQGLQNHSAMVSLADNAGAAMAQQGASGTRENDALQQRIDFQGNQFNRQLDLQDRENALAAQNLGRQYSNQFDDIGREIDSWHPGGYRYQAKTLANVYAGQMHGLKMQEYDRAIKDAKATGLDYLAAGLSGAGQGMGFGMKVDNLADQMQGKAREEEVPGFKDFLPTLSAMWPTQDYFSSAVPENFGSSLLRGRKWAWQTGHL